MSAIERAREIRAGAPLEAQAVTIEEAAALLQVSERTIKRYRATGVLPKSKRLGVARIPLSAITALLAGEAGQPSRPGRRR